MTYKYTYRKKYAQTLSLIRVPHGKHEGPTNLEEKYNPLT